MKYRDSVIIRRTLTGIVCTLLLIVDSILFVSNMRLKNDLRQLFHPILREKNSSNVTMAFAGEGVKTVINEEQGIWDKTTTGHKSSIQIKRELRIGETESNSHYIFYEPYPVKSDNEGNIYVAESTEGVIIKFSPTGQNLLSIGRKGQGPGELFGLFDFVIENDTLTVFDCGAQRLSRFTAEGVFLGVVPLEVMHTNPPMIVDGFVSVKSGRYIASFYDRKSNLIIHMFSSKGTLLTSFGEPFKLKETLGLVSTNLRMINAGGPLTEAKNELIFSQHNPYEIRLYDYKKGTLRTRILRKNRFMPPASVELVGKSYKFESPVQSTAVGVWQDIIVNTVWIPLHIKSKHGTIVDFFDLSGRLLTTVFLEEHVYFSYVTHHGKLYGVERSNETSDGIVRYGLTMTIAANN